MIKLTPLGSKVWVDITGQDVYSVDKSDIDFVQLDETHISIDLLGGGPILLSDLEMNGVVPANMAALKAAIATVFPNAGGAATTTYLVYTALLSQTGTGSPVAIVLENTLGGIPVWTRNSVGLYIGTLAGAFPADKVVMFLGNTLDGINVYSGDRETPPDSIYITTFQSNVLADTMLVKTPLEIRVYGN